MSSSADCALFQYSARSGQRRLIGLLSDACKADGTWREGERIEKGHSQLVWLDGKIYIGTMGFHDAAGNENSPQMQLALKSHGAHLMAYDPAADRLVDCSRTQPDGVFFKGRGFMTLAAIPESGVVGALTVPHGDLLLYDPKTGQPRMIVPGVAEEFGRHVSREIIPAGSKIYYAYTAPEGSKAPGHMYVFDMETGKRSDKPVEIASNPWNGQVRTSDGTGIYLTNQPGELFRFHPENGALETLGNLIPEEELRPIQDSEFRYAGARVLGMALSADERYIYTIPVRKKTALADSAGEGKAKGLGMRPVGLCRHDLRTGVSRRIAEMPKNFGGGNITGSAIRDSQGSVYFVRHGGPGGTYGLVKVSFRAAGE